VKVQGSGALATNRHEREGALLRKITDILGLVCVNELEAVVDESRINLEKKSRSKLEKKSRSKLEKKSRSKLEKKSRAQIEKKSRGNRKVDARDSENFRKAPEAARLGHNQQLKVALAENEQLKIEIQRLNASGPLAARDSGGFGKPPEAARLGQNEQLKARIEQLEMEIQRLNASSPLATTNTGCVQQAATKPTPGSTPYHEADAVFRKYDKDKNGSLDEMEVQCMLEEHFNMQPTEAEEFLFSNLDSSGDGIVSREEFANAFQIWCERHGTVAQGPVSQSTASKTVAEPEVGTA